ncbi:MAG: hypothetical protein ABS96_34925 [Lysobacteraceae bacterium SCN 69-123]|nr:MAG: hypothetical protein ABS96_34925 [Xanthomonadaceae bacterium SCN 69-123]
MPGRRDRFKACIRKFLAKQARQPANALVSMVSLATHQHDHVLSVVARKVSFDRTGLAFPQVVVKDFPCATVLSPAHILFLAGGFGCSTTTRAWSTGHPRHPKESAA